MNINWRRHMLRKHNSEKTMQNTYKKLYTLILIDLKVYIIDTCDIIFKV